MGFVSKSLDKTDKISLNGIIAIDRNVKIIDFRNLFSSCTSNWLTSFNVSMISGRENPIKWESFCFLVCGREVPTIKEK